MAKIRSKVLIESKINTSLEDIKRTIDTNMKPKEKIHKIEDIINNLYE